ncbi:50S ribosomal protein L25 [Chloroflexota bacterium]
MEKIELSAATREILGKKVRFLRRQGITPVHLFGHNLESVALQCDTTPLQHVLARTGKTKLISLKLDKARTTRNVVVREVQKEPQTGKLLHVDFYQVNLKEEIKVNVPIVPLGEAPALKSKDNFLTQELDSLVIECLPDKIPSNVEVDISSLAEAGQAIRVRNISLGEGITVLNNPEQLVLKISIRTAEKLAIEEEVEAPVEAPIAEEALVEESPPPRIRGLYLKQGKTLLDLTQE